MIKVRVAKAEDASRLLEIYAYYVENTAISFEYEVPSLAEFTERIRNTLVTYPYLVAEEDGRIVGYIYASRFAQRAAYDWAAGTSVYIDRDCRRKGIGKLLYEKFEAILKLQNITNLYAGAADPMEDGDPYLTRSSEHFHEAIGYRTVARHHACGRLLCSRICGSAGCFCAHGGPENRTDNNTRNQADQYLTAKAEFLFLLHTFTPFNKIYRSFRNALDCFRNSKYYYT